MSLNYRIVRTENGLPIFDVYYNESGEPIATHATPSHVSGETVEELREQLALMSEALAQPILNENNIGAGESTKEQR